MLDNERGKTSESPILTDQAYQTLINFKSHSAVEVLMRTLVIVEGEVAPESIFHTRSGVWPSLGGSQ